MSELIKSSVMSPLRLLHSRYVVLAAGLYSMTTKPPDWMNSSAGGVQPTRIRGKIVPSACTSCVVPSAVRERLVGAARVNGSGNVVFGESSTKISSSTSQL